MTSAQEAPPDSTGQRRIFIVKNHDDTRFLLGLLLKPVEPNQLEQFLAEAARETGVRPPDPSRAGP